MQPDRMSLASKHVNTKRRQAGIVGAILLACALSVLDGCKGEDPATAACPEGMALVDAADGPLCIHAFEVRLEPLQRGADLRQVLLDDPTQVVLRSELNLMPTKTTWYRADAVCKAHSMHLCTSQEWEDACDGVPGDGGAEYGTVDGTYSVGDCSFTDVPGEDRKPLAVTGSFRRCHTPTGLYDMAGNLWEWTDPGQRDEANLPLIDKRGGGHYGRDSVACSYSSVGSHPPSFEGTIGFRCCVALSDL